MVVENAFGRLKGQWRCMLKRMDFALENVPSVVAACVILHNFCEMYGDHFQSEWESMNMLKEKWIHHTQAPEVKSLVIFV